MKKEKCSLGRKRRGVALLELVDCLLRPDSVRYPTLRKASGQLFLKRDSVFV